MNLQFVLNKGTNVLVLNPVLENSLKDNLTKAQFELYEWIKNYMKEFQHSPSIRQMMEAMSLKSPAPIQSRLKHLQEKGYITWQEGKARTLKVIENIIEGIPLMGAVAAGGLIETYSDISERLDFSDIFNTKDVFALTVNGDSMIDAYIAHGDLVLMEPVREASSLRNGTIVCAMVPGAGTTLKYFRRENSRVILEAANPSYDPIIIDSNDVTVQGKLLAVLRRA